MTKYFAELNGNLVGAETYIRFEAEDLETAKEAADNYAEDNYCSYGEDPYDEDGSPNFYSKVAEYNEVEHDEYFKHINTEGYFEILL